MRRTAVILTVALWVAGCETQPVGPDVNEKSAADYNVSLGYAYLKQGNLALAKEKLVRAEKQDDNNPRVHSALGLLYERLGNPAEADRQYEQALRLAPKDPEIQNNYAVFLCQQDRVDEGVKLFEEAAHNPLYRTPEAAYTNAGICLRSAKRYADAEQNFIVALKVRPNFPQAAFQLADLRFELGQTAAARNEVDKYLGSFPATPELLLLGVRIARSTGDRLGEEKYARQLRNDFPQSQEARSLKAQPPKAG